MAAGSTVVQAFSAQSVINTAGVSDYEGAARTHTLTVVAGTGVSAGTVVLELSQDGTNWWAPASNSVASAAPGTGSVSVVDQIAQYSRARISVAAVGGTLSAWLGRAE